MIDLKISDVETVIATLESWLDAFETDDVYVTEVAEAKTALEAFQKLHAAYVKDSVVARVVRIVEE